MTRKARGSILSFSRNPKVLEEADSLDRALEVAGLRRFAARNSGFLQADIAGLPTTLGSLLFTDYMPRRDAFVVAKLIFLGK